MPLLSTEEIKSLNGGGEATTAASNMVDALQNVRDAWKTWFSAAKIRQDNTDRADFLEWWISIGGEPPSSTFYTSFRLPASLDEARRSLAQRRALFEKNIKRVGEAKHATMEAWRCADIALAPVFKGRKLPPINDTAVYNTAIREWLLSNTDDTGRASNRKRPAKRPSPFDVEEQPSKPPCKISRNE